MANIDQVEDNIQEIERVLIDLNEKVKGKQNQRFLTSHMWMMDHLDRNILRKVNDLKQGVNEIKAKHLDLPSTHFEIIDKYGDDISSSIREMIDLYKERPGFMDADLRWNAHLPKMLEKIKSIKNRYLIIRGQIRSKKKYNPDEDPDFF